MALGLLFAIAGALLLAPSGILNLETTPLLLTVGLVCLEMLLNLAAAYTLEPLHKQFSKQREHIAKLYGKIRIITGSFGFLVAPFLSSLCTKLTSYETTCDLVALILSIFLVLFCVVLACTRPVLTHKDLIEPLLEDELEI